MENYNLIKIKPCDNTFFGDGNRFDFGISNVLKSKNEPYPSVFYGAIFSALLANDEGLMKEFQRCKNTIENITKLQENTLEIDQIYLYDEDNNGVYIKSPLDIFISDNGEKVMGKFIKNKGRNCFKIFDYMMCTPTDTTYKRANKYYMDICDKFKSYKNELGIAIRLVHEDRIFKKNIKVGISIDDTTNTTTQGMLYRIEQTEFVNNKWSYLVQYKLKDNTIKELDQGFLKLGGENKVCKYESISENCINEIIKENFMEEKNKNKKIKGRIKIILTTDTYFKESLKSLFEKNGLKILGISNDKPIYIGGYDMVSKNGKGGIRKMYKGYSAGTVILAELCEKKESTLNDIYKLVLDKNIKGFNKSIIFEEEI